MTCNSTTINRFLCVFLASVFTVSLTLAPFFCSRTAAAPDSSISTPNFELPDLNGSSVSLSNFKGQKAVLLYFWATWCQYCISVRPEVIRLRNRISQSDLALLAINVGGSDSLAKVKRFEEANPAPYTVLYDADGKTARSFKVLGIPHFILIDKDGAIKYSGNDMPLDPMVLLKH